jgi:uncharacterized protein YbjT (DUF2867 family)
MPAPSGGDPVRIAVVGATGPVGRLTVDAVVEAWHDPVRIARRSGVDVITGAGSDDAPAGVDAVIDVTNTPERDADRAREFFGTVSANLLAAEARAAVAHHVLLSIVGIDRVAGNPFEVEMAGEVLLLPGPQARIAPTTFEEWLGWTTS